MLRLFSALPSLAIATCLLVPLSAHADVRREHTVLGDWQLDIARDQFSGEIACRLAARDHHAFYRAHAIAFRFRTGRDVSHAVYRIDAGPPHVSRDDLSMLVASEVPLDRGPMDNAREGLVWVPFDVLRRGNSVAIEPGPGLRPRQYHFRGLIALHDIAVERGCTPENRFVAR